LQLALEKPIVIWLPFPVPGVGGSSGRMDALRNRTAEELRELQENTEEIERLALESQEVGAGRRDAGDAVWPLPALTVAASSAGSGAAAGEGDGPGRQPELGRAEPEVSGAAGNGARRPLEQIRRAAEAG